MSSNPLRVGYVPEHFSTPLHFAKTHFSAPFTLFPFPSGTGAMISALQSKDIDLAIGLTEGWIAGLARAAAANETASYALVGTYVESPLRWAISTGAKRKDVAMEQDPGEWVKGLKGKKIGVSRIGSGSHVMGYVMADKLGWLEGKEEPFEVVVLDTFEQLREAVNDGKADFFMWEHFTSKKYFDNGEIRKIGEIMTPWPGWHMVANPELVGDERLDESFELVDEGIKHYWEDSGEAVEYISSQLDYSKEDAEEWMKTVQFAKEVKGVRSSVVDDTLKVLKNAGVVEEHATGDSMIKIRRQEQGLFSAFTG